MKVDFGWDDNMELHGSSLIFNIEGFVYSVHQ